MLDKRIKESLEKLPGIYTKDDNSNIAKFLEVIMTPLLELDEEINEIAVVKNITSCYGAHLDRHGENVDQLRGEMSDSLYKLLIRSKIRTNISPGNINSLLQYISAVLQIPIESIGLYEQDWGAEGYEAGRLDISISYSVLNQLLVTIDQFLEVIDSMTPASVRTMLFGQGTFQFASESDISELDNEKGFSDLNQETGGRLGAVYHPPRQSRVVR